MHNEIIKEIETLKEFTEDIEIPQKKAELAKIKEAIKFAEGKITAYNEILTQIQDIKSKSKTAINVLYGE